MLLIRCGGVGTAVTFYSAKASWDAVRRKREPEEVNTQRGYLCYAIL